MYLNIFDKDLVISVSVQVMKSGLTIAHLYYDSKPRSYEDCVRFGSPRVFYTLFDCIDYFYRIYGKVIITAHS